MTVNILGMMSGTSGDGIDGALVSFDENGGAVLKWHDSFSFSAACFKRLKSLMSGADSKAITLGASYVAELYSEAFKIFCGRHSEKADFIAAHGQTVFHHPAVEYWDEIPLTGTLQLLDGSRLAVRTGCPVICGFRTADMAAGGQGAPLVPYADLHFLGTKAKRDMIVLNIGGMANVSVIKASENSLPQLVAAFDTGPGNVLSDGFIQARALGRYDKNGQMAAEGKTSRELLQTMLADPYFALLPPKSTGREYFNMNWLTGFDCENIADEDMMSTLLDLTVESISEAVEKLCQSVVFPADLVVSGGGAFNTELMKRLGRRLKNTCEVSVSNAWGMPVEAKEAMAFASLGYAFVSGRPANVLAATGARKEVILGELHPVIGQRLSLKFCNQDQSCQKN